VARLAGGVQNLLEDLDRAERARAAVARLRNWLPTFRGSVSASGELSLTLDPGQRPAAAPLEDDVVELVDRLGIAARAAGRGVALFIDELQELGHESMEALCAAMHRANQETHPVVLVGAGLPTLPGLLAEAKSYAERLFAYPEIGALDDPAAREAIVAPTRDVELPGGRISFSEAALARMVAFAEGYPMMLQAIGKHTWAHAQQLHVEEGDVAAAEQDAFEELSRELFRSRWQRATPRQRDYLTAIAVHGHSARSAEAARLANFNSPQAAGPTRDELIAKGLIYAPRRGTVAFTVPQFDRFIRDATDHELPASESQQQLEL
jgi:hypothetical protein